MPYTGTKTFFFKLLKIVLPNWMAEDLYARLMHPYWRKHKTTASIPLCQTSCSVSQKIEKASNRPPFKYVNEKVVLSTLARHHVYSILDVGCGQGNLVRYLRTKGFDAYGITINPQEQEVAQQGGLPVFLCDIQQHQNIANLPRRMFDAVVSFDCIEHLERPLEALNHINQVIKPNGLFICYLPPVRWIECDYHIIVYSPRQFRWLLNLTGFDLLAQSGHYYWGKKGMLYIAQKINEKKPVYQGVLE